MDDEPGIHELVRLAQELIGGLDIKTCHSEPEALTEAIGYAPNLILPDRMMLGTVSPPPLQALRQIAAISTVPIALLRAKPARAGVDGLKGLGASGQG
ncbi:MAG: hypothetical protein H4O13_09240 [Xanthomonadales bacterium]|nr:hypothetical protein [Xanthomonadales bacterium]